MPTPKTPLDLLDSFDVIEFDTGPNGTLHCAYPLLWETLKADLERYIKECESCPDWAQSEKETK